MKTPEAEQIVKSHATAEGGYKTQVWLSQESLSSLSPQDDSQGNHLLPARLGPLPRKLSPDLSSYERARV